jgi:hypothetical protein
MLLQDLVELQGVEKKIVKRILVKDNTRKPIMYIV